jgi:hypothetical protein
MGRFMDFNGFVSIGSSGGRLGASAFAYYGVVEDFLHMGLGSLHQDHLGV